MPFGIVILNSNFAEENHGWLSLQVSPTSTPWDWPSIPQKSHEAVPLKGICELNLPSLKILFLARLLVSWCPQSVFPSPLQRHGNSVVLLLRFTFSTFFIYIFLTMEPPIFWPPFSSWPHPPSWHQWPLSEQRNPIHSYSLKLPAGLSDAPTWMPLPHPRNSLTMSRLNPNCPKLALLSAFSPAYLSYAVNHSILAVLSKYLVQVQVISWRAVVRALHPSRLPSGRSSWTKGSRASSDLWFNYMLAFQFLKKKFLNKLLISLFLMHCLGGRLEFIILFGSKKIE